VQVVFADYDPDLLDRFEVVVDQDAEPADFDEALATFLLKIVQTRHSAGITDERVVDHASRLSAKDYTAED